jgi:plastocyanin
MATVTVKIQGMKFVPDKLTIKAGDSVVWKNTSNMAHTATADSGSTPDTGDINPGASSSPQVFAAAGTVKYHCEIHPSMHGEVTAS